MHTAQAEGDNIFQPPMLLLREYDKNVTYLQNLCDRQQQFFQKEFDLRDALRGLTLHPVLSYATPEFFVPDRNTFGINQTYPEILVFLLDEVARRAGFEWRETFGLVGFPAKGTSFDDQLLWSTDAYDFAVGGYAHTLPRFAEGLNFPAGWFDYSIIMVGKKDDTESSFSVFTFLKPFTTEVWIALLGAIFFSGFVYWVIEMMDAKADDSKKPHRRLAGKTWNSAMTMTGHVDQPRNKSAPMMFTLSLAFFSLLVTSAYTANLASFLVVRNTPTLQINTVGDAVDQKLRMCVWRGTTTEIYVRTKYRNAILIPFESNVAVYQGIYKGQCDIILTEGSTWRGRRSMNITNPNCGLETKGQVETYIEGGFVTAADHGTLCTSLIRDVLNVHFLDMRADGFLDKELNNLERFMSDTSCARKKEAEGSASSSEEDNSGQLDLMAMGGGFICHGTISILALTIAIISRCNSVRLKKRKTFFSRHISFHEDEERQTGALSMGKGDSHVSATMPSEVISEDFSDENFEENPAGNDPVQFSNTMSRISRNGSSLDQKATIGDVWTLWATKI